MVVPGGLEEHRVPVEGQGEIGPKLPVAPGGKVLSRSLRVPVGDPERTEARERNPERGIGVAQREEVGLPVSHPLAVRAPACERVVREEGERPRFAAARSCATASSALFAAQGDDAPSGLGPSW